MSHHTRILYARTMAEIPKRILTREERARARRTRILCLYLPAGIALLYMAVAVWRLMGSAW